MAVAITKRKKKWGRFPQSYDKLLDVTLRMLSAVLRKTKVIYIIDLKNPEPERRSGGSVTWKRKRVFGSYDIKEDVIKIRILKSSVAGIHFHNRVKMIVTTALHEAMEKIRYRTGFSIKHRYVELWEYCVFERMTEEQIAYVWSLLPSLPSDS